MFWLAIAADDISILDIEWNELDDGGKFTSFLPVLTPYSKIKTGKQQSSKLYG